MSMTLAEARAECERWFTHLEVLERQSRALQDLAADRRRGLCDAAEGARRRAAIQSEGVTVYDGENLYNAVRTLLSHIDKIGPA